MKLPSKVKAAANDNLSFNPKASHTRTSVPINMDEGISDDESVINLPTFPSYGWPLFIVRCTDCGDTMPKRDAILLGCLTVLGATLTRFVATHYSKKLVYPSIETFIPAPSTSGKGVITPCMELAMPFHLAMYGEYKKAQEKYRQEKAAWDSMGKQRKDYPEPKEPPLTLFNIAANNSSTGIQENLCDNQGIGLIADSEADTLSSALNTDYGQWGNVLRKNFDHDRLSYNRRKDHEYRECETLSFGVLLSGTYGQIAPLIPSAENGLFYRHVFYCLPPIDEWVDQFDDDSLDHKTLFRTWGERWKKVIDALKQHASLIEFRLSKAQQQEFNEQHSRLFSHAVVTLGGQMRSQVARMATNILRMMTVVAMVRSLDQWLTADSFDGCTIHDILSLPGISASEDIPLENVKDGIVPRLTLTISDDDFRAVLSLADPLYRHSAHVLTYIGDNHANRRKLSPIDELLETLPAEFSRRELVEMAKERSIPENTIDTFLSRSVEKGMLKKSERGIYQFTSNVAPSHARVCNNATESLKERKEDEIW